MTLDKDTRFLIVGLGLLGGSYAKALKGQGFSVEAVTRFSYRIFHFAYFDVRRWL